MSALPIAIPEVTTAGGFLLVLALMLPFSASSPPSCWAGAMRSAWLS